MESNFIPISPKKARSLSSSLLSRDREEAAAERAKSEEGGIWGDSSGEGEEELHSSMRREERR